MSTTSIEFTNLVAETPLDAVSVQFCDPTNTFGLVRKDNSDIVISALTNLVHAGTGYYTYSFTDPAPGLLYRYFLKVVQQGGLTVYLERDTSIAETTPLEINGRYATYAGLTAMFGVESVNKWAGVDGNDMTAIAAAITTAINTADAIVDGSLLDGPYLTPFKEIADGGLGIPPKIRECANKLAAVILYDAQGTIDFNAEQGEPQNRLVSLRLQVMRDLGQLKTGRARLVLDDGTEYVTGATYVPVASYNFDSDSLQDQRISSYLIDPQS